MAIDFSAAKTPPRRAKTLTPKTVQPALPKRMEREQGLLDLGSLAQGVCLMTKQYADAATIGMRFPPVAKELAKLADTYPQIAKPIDLLIQVGPFGALLTAVAPFVMQMAANHGMIQAQGDIVSPKVLDAQMQAEIAKAQTEAMRQQQAALREAQQAQAEYEKMMRESQPEMALAG